MFNDFAKTVATWDKQLIDNDRKVQTLNDHAIQMKNSQNELLDQLEIIKSQQKTLEDELKNIENQFDEKLDDYAASDIERRDNYELAAKIDKELDTLTTNIQEIIGKLNETYEANAKKNPNPTYQKIVQILESHLKTLDWIDKRCIQLEAQLSSMSK
jgi:chromosome segregation ATPase